MTEDQVTWGLDEVTGEGGEVDFDDGEGGGVALGVGEGRNIISSYICGGGFVFAGDVDEECGLWARRGWDCFGSASQ